MKKVDKVYILLAHDKKDDIFTAVSVKDNMTDIVQDFENVMASRQDHGFVNYFIRSYILDKGWR